MTDGIRIRIDDRKYQKFKRAIESLGASVMSFGVHEEQGSVQLESGITMAELAAIHEFGAPSVDIPARPWLQPFVDNLDSFTSNLADRIGHVLLKNFMDASGLQRVLKQEALRGAGKIQQRIADRIPPKNEDSTIAKKGSDVPLIDSGQFRQSIRGNVR